ADAGGASSGASASALPLNEEPGLNAKRCSTGGIGAEERSKPPSEPTPLPRPTSSMCGITACGMPEPAGAAVIGASEEPAPVQEEGLVWGRCGTVVPVATAKLAMGRALINAWRIASRVAS